jgi:hypothetical protein
LYEHISSIYSLATENVKLRGRGLYADNLCKVKIYLKAETFKSRSVIPDPLKRFVGHSFKFLMF